MKITCKYQVLFGQVQVLWHFHTPSTQVHQVLINMYLSTSTVLDPNPGDNVVVRCCFFVLSTKCGKCSNTDPANKDSSIPLNVLLTIPQLQLLVVQLEIT